MSLTPPVFTLNQLNKLIKNEISSSFCEPVHFIAEINSFSVNRSGHAYLDLVEKSSDGDSIIAQLRATIWAGVFRTIKPYFESVTGEPLRAGIKIMACGNVSFHEVYGLSINIVSITPEYTIGEMALQRKRTIDQLNADGVFDMNKSLQLPMLVSKIAVISSSQAAGYGDFVKQLQNNPHGYRFFTYLFEASMQGDEAENTIILQLERIAKFAHLFDCIVLIRGGGSKADLSCFDKYNLCANLCQMPLPIITGIGHDRDESVADLVANTPLKTPTAVAQFIIDRANMCERLVDEKVAQIKTSIHNFLNRKQADLERIQQKIFSNIRFNIQQNRNKLNYTVNAIAMKMNHKLQQSMLNVENINNKIELNNPANILRKGYSYTMHNGSIVLSASQLAEGDTITTVFSNGSANSTITKTSQE